MEVRVVRVSIKRRPVRATKVPALKDLFGLDELPLAVSDVEVELKGIPTSHVNALRRVLIDEMTGYALAVPPDGFKCSNPFMLPPYVNQRISLIPLKAQISPSLIHTDQNKGARLKLSVENPRQVRMTVYAGDMEFVEGNQEILFNPTFAIADLNPGERIDISDIMITAGHGRDNAIYNVGRCAAYTHLDIPQYTKDEICSVPTKKTLEEKGPIANQSGYKTSCLIADPRHHVLTVKFPATTPMKAESKAILIDACANIEERLNMISGSINDMLDETVKDASKYGIQYTIVTLEGGLSEGILQVPGETDTIGELLKRTIFMLEPDIAFVSSVVSVHENKLMVSLRSVKDVTKILKDSIQNAIATFGSIKQQIQDIEITDIAPKKR